MTIGPEDKYIGKRVARWRDIAGMTQQQLADQVGYTREYISMIENGHKAITKRSLLIDLAKALRVSVTDLIAMPYEAHSREDMLALSIAAGVRAALDSDVDGVTVTSEELAEQATNVIAARMVCDNERLATLLPAAISQARAAAYDTREELSLAGLDALVKVCVYGSFVLKTTGNMDLSMRMAERARLAADRLGDPVHIAAAQQALAQSLMASGLRERALRMSIFGISLVQSQLSDPAALAWFGLLHMQAGLCAASLGRAEEANAHLDEAAQAATEARGGHGWGDEFTPANVQLWKVGVALENGEPGQAVQAARLVDPIQLRSPQRVTRLHIDRGRGLYHAGEHDKAIEEFQLAYATAPTEVRHRASVREITGELVRTARRNAGSPALRDLAVKVGVDPASTG
ncbi:MAG TPA: helix-turn-helix transcriptional regulator [Candidatus Limnocylindrales bacterium]|nr:helix-turn-helix transcriptional regulator [Candidatus Limnocylindrales bacterium]